MKLNFFSEKGKVGAHKSESKSIGFIDTPPWVLSFTYIPRLLKHPRPPNTALLTPRLPY